MSLDPKLDAYLRDAWQHNQESYQAPAHGQPFRSPMFQFVRKAKAEPIFGQMDALAAAELIEQHLATWQLEDTDMWRACFPLSDDARIEFVDTWDKIKWPSPEVERALEAAKASPLYPTRSYSPTYALFISLAGHLQRNVTGPVLLPCRKMAEALNCEAMSVSRYRNQAIKDGILRWHRRGRKAHREADEFFFQIERFDWTSGKEISSKNLNICVTPSTESACYTDSQELQDIERKKEIQERQEKKETQEMQRETRVRPRELKTCSVKRGPYIPTTSELAEALEQNRHIRRV